MRFLCPLPLCSYGLEAGAIVLVSALGQPAASVLQPPIACGDGGGGGGVLSELAEQRAIATDLAEAAAAAVVAAVDGGRQQEEEEQQRQHQQEGEERAAAAGAPPEALAALPLAAVKAEPLSEPEDGDGAAAELPQEKRQRVA